VITDEGKEFTILDLAYSPASGLLAVSAFDLNEVHVYNVDTYELVARLPAINHTAIAISTDGRFLAVDSIDNIEIFEIQSRQRTALLTGHLATVNSIAFSSNGELIASGSVDRTVRLWKRSGELITALTGHLAEVGEVAFTPDGRTLVSIDDRGAAT